MDYKKHVIDQKIRCNWYWKSENIGQFNQKCIIIFENKIGTLWYIPVNIVIICLLIPENICKAYKNGLIGVTLTQK